MMRAEFIKLSQSDQRTQNRWSLAFIAGFAVFSLIGCWFAPRLEFDWSKSLDWSAFLAFVVVSVLCLVWLARRSSRNELRCPHCRKGLQAFAVQIVIASGRCGFCGGRILEHADAEP
jgi:uncharacterized membrane protein YhhN